MHLSVNIEGITGFVNPGSSKNTGKAVGKGVDIFEYVSFDTIALYNTDMSLSGNHIKSKSAMFRHGEIHIGDLGISSRANHGNSYLSVDKASITGLSLIEIVHDGLLNIKDIRIHRIQSSGLISLPRAQAIDPDKKTVGVHLPFSKISIHSFSINSLKLDNNFLHEDLTFTIQTSADIELRNIHLEGPELDHQFLNNVEGSVKIRNTLLSVPGQEIELKTLNLNLGDKGLNLAGLSVFPGPGKNPRMPIEVKELSLEYLSLNEIDIEKLILENRLKFSTLQVDGLKVDMTYEGKPEDQGKGPQNKSFKGIEAVDYKEMLINNVSTEIEWISGNDSKTLIVEDLFLEHSVPEYEGVNLMDYLDFSFNRLHFSNPANSTVINIESGEFDNKQHELALKAISGGNLKEKTDEELQNGWQYTSDELVIGGLQIQNTVPTRLEMKSLELSNSDITIISKEQEIKKPEIKFDIKSFRHIGNLMTKLRVQTTTFNEVRVKYQTFNDSTSHVIVADSIGLTINEINIDTSIFDHAENDIVRKMTIDLKGRTSYSADSLYMFRSGLVSYDFNRNAISIDSFQVIPTLGDAEFFEKAVYQTDRISLFGNRVMAYDFRLEELLEDDLIHFGRLDVDGLQLDIVRDKNYARKPNDFKSMPQEMLRNMDQKITIDSVRMFNSYVKYGEYVEKSSMPGSVFFDRFALNMYNLSSDLPRPDPTTALKVKIGARVMGKAHFDLSVVFPYVSDSNDFWLSANSEEIDLTTLNPLTENVLGLSIKEGEGRIENSFITGNSRYSRGSMLFTYNKLKLNLYNRKKAEQNKGMFAGITRFLINDLLIHKNNPKFGKNPRMGQVYFERDPEKAILNYVWKSLLSGMLSSIGINKKEQRQERRDMKKINNQK